MDFQRLPPAPMLCLMTDMIAEVADIIVAG